MYEQFGFVRGPNRNLSFKLFVPDNTIDPAQYQGGDRPKIANVRIVGDFQTTVNPAATNWNAATGLQMSQTPHANGLLFTYTLPATFPDGYYQYKYVVTFQNGAVRWIGDPCTKYGGDQEDNSAFVVGGTPLSVTPLPAQNRVRGADLILYELMIDDFTREYRANRAPIDAVVDKLAELKKLGVNAIEFMPWIAWPDSDDFSWGYDPAFFFSVESGYTLDPAGPLDKLARLANLISACHDLGLMVILDIVLQHASAGAGTRGFPYYWLWQEPDKSPFVGQFTSADSFGSLPLNYHNPCTLHFIADVCKYWSERFAVDGFRFDQVSGFHNPDFPTRGAPALVADLKNYFAGKGMPDYPLMLEDTFDFDVIRDTNNIRATHGWFDMLRSYSGEALSFSNRPQPQFMRVLNSARDFNSPIAPVIYLENHDHSTVTLRAGGRNNWYRVQPYMIALATCPGAILLFNGQEFARSEYMPEPGTDANLPRPQQRVNSRPLRWAEATDSIGQSIRSRYEFLLQLRKNYPGLRSPAFYPDYYDSQWYRFSPEGYGLDFDKQVIIYHRWGNAADGQLERFMIALNFSGSTQYTDIPFPTNGAWSDLINSNQQVQVFNFRLTNYPINSNWGCVFYQK
jgi:pullulanase